ncbi:hypothetical protein AB6N24_17020 [Cellulomonas sp. 179-A 4D5 NHS]|uniref:hypothetical protein n=1 Tax=Cellulomonas sp. 179-A 4D5 NHS TaxID=3142378 RepID=UPI00399FD483
MSDAPQDPGTGEQDGGYGYPTLEQEVTPEVLEGGAGTEGSGDAPDEDAGSAEDGGAPVPGELVEDPSAVEPTD